MIKTIRRSKETTRVGDKEITTETEDERGSPAESIASIATVLGIIVALVTAVVGVLSYRATTRNDDAARTLESKKPFYERQIAIYVDAMDAASRIATHGESAPADVDKFEQLFWGRMGAVEDEDVDKAMVLFRTKLAEREEQKQGGKPLAPKCLQLASLLLAHCVKKSWASTWKVTLTDPPELPCGGESFKSIFACR
jgi:hypothetical protein